MRRFNETEFDKITFELLEKVYPTQALRSYYNLGMAEILSIFTSFIDKEPEKINAKNMKDLILHYSNEVPEVAEFYERLKKDKSK